eukprot:m.77475 g.77475  ORF g.77475 m.77475 type:complete len:151 (-) comp12626_c0_seq2:931-1383(-)
MSSSVSNQFLNRRCNNMLRSLRIVAHLKPGNNCVRRWSSNGCIPDAKDLTGPHFRHNALSGLSAVALMRCYCIIHMPYTFITGFALLQMSGLCLIQSGGADQNSFKMKWFTKFRSLQEMRNVPFVLEMNILLRKLWYKSVAQKMGIGTYE